MPIQVGWTPRATRTAGHQARNGALLFGAASLVTLLGLLLPHEAEVDSGNGSSSSSPARPRSRSC